MGPVPSVLINLYKEASRQKKSLPPTLVSLHAIGLVVQQLNDILAREIGVERDGDIAYRVYELMPLKYGKTLLQVNLLDRALVTNNQQARLYLDEYRTAVKHFNELIES